MRLLSPLYRYARVRLFLGGWHPSARRGCQYEYTPARNNGDKVWDDSFMDRALSRIELANMLRVDKRVVHIDGRW